MVGEHEAVAKLLSEKSIAELKDYDLRLGYDVAKLADELDSKLYGCYGDVLCVTADTNALSQMMKDVDVKFRDLCFNDEVFGLSKLPDIPAISVDRDYGWDTVSVGLSPVLVAVSKWSLAVSNFISRFPGDKFFDDMLSQFEKMGKIQWQAYKEDTVRPKCRDLTQFLIETLAGQRRVFSLQQLIRLHQLVITKDFFSQQESSKIQDLIFKAIFAIDLDQLLHNPTPIVKSFVKSSFFNSKLRDNITKDIETHLQALEKLQPSTETNVAFPEDVDKSGIIEYARLYSFGLTNSYRKHAFEHVEAILKLLQQLKDQHQQAEHIATFKSKLEDFLQAAMPDATTSTPNAEQNVDVDELVSNLIEKHNDKMYRESLSRQLDILNSM